MQSQIEAKKAAKFRQTPLGRLLSSESPQVKMDPYTQALLDCNTSSDLYNSYSFVKTKEKKKKNFLTVMRSLIKIPREKISVFWLRIETNGWKPETRQEASLTQINGKLILIGGISRSISKDVNLFSVEEKTWQKASYFGEVNEPRFGHSAVKYEENVIIYGGGTNFDSKHQLRECLNGVHMFSPSLFKWEYVKTHGTYLPARKYHSANIIGAHMFIYGGMNQKNNLLADAAMLHMQKTVWKAVDIIGNGPGKVAFHTSALVLSPLPNSTESIYNFASKTIKIQYPGIYFFGGLNSEKKASNDLWVLKVGKRPLEWFRPTTFGQGPSPRFLHSSLYNSNLNILLIFGGRVDLDNTSAYTCFNDVFILDLQSMLWLNVTVFGEVPMGRSGHTSEGSGSKVFIFGGVTNTCYCSGDMWMLELDQSLVSTMDQTYAKRLKHEAEIVGYKLQSGETTLQSKILSRSRTGRFSHKRSSSFKS